MRIISQDGTKDWPYDGESLEVVGRTFPYPWGDEIGIEYHIQRGKTPLFGRNTYITNPAFREDERGKAIKELQEIRKAYADGEKLYQIGGE